MFLPRVSRGLEFEEIGVISGRGSSSSPSIAVHPLNGEVCVAYQDCCEGPYADVRVKCLRDGVWKDLGSPIRYGAFGDLYIDETGYYLAVWDWVTWWRGAIRVFKFYEDWVQIGHLSKFSDQEYHPSLFSLTVVDGNPYVAFWGREKERDVKLYVSFFDGSSWRYIKDEVVYTYYWARGGSIGIIPDGMGGIYLMWNRLIGRTGPLFVERWNGFGWGYVGSHPIKYGIYNSAVFLSPTKNPGVVYFNDDPRGLFANIYDGYEWIDIDGNIIEDGDYYYSAEVTSHTKSVVFSPGGDMYVAFKKSIYWDDFESFKILIKRYEPSSEKWVGEYEAEYLPEWRCGPGERYCRCVTDSPSVVEDRGYIYIAEAGCSSITSPKRVHIKRAILPFGKAQFEECFARVVSSKDALEELMNRSCLVDNMIFYNSFLYDVVKDPSRSLRERVFAGAYLYEFPQYLNDERVSYLNSSEFVSLLRNALFEEEDEFIKEKAMFSLVREENEYVNPLIEDVLSLAGYPLLYYMFERHSTLLSSQYLGNLLFELAFFSPSSLVRWNAMRALRVLGTSSIPFNRFSDIISGDFPLDMKNSAMDVLTDIFIIGDHDDLPLSERENLGEIIIPYAGISETRDNALRALGALDVKWDYLLDELKEGEFTPYILSAISTELRGRTAAELYVKGKELLIIAKDSSYEPWRRIYAAAAAYQIGLREWESPQMEILRKALSDEDKQKLWEIYYAISHYIFDETLSHHLRITSLRFSISTGDEAHREQLIASVLSTGDFSLIQEALRLGEVYKVCGAIPDIKVTAEEYSKELSSISLYWGKIENEILKLEEKLKRKLSINEDCPKGCKGRNCRNCIGIAGKIEEVISKLNEVKEQGIQADINAIKGAFEDFKEKVLGYYFFFADEGIAFKYPEPERYREINNELKMDLSFLRNRVLELKKKVKNEKSLEKIEEVLEKLDEIDEKIGEMDEAVEEAKDEVNEILSGSSFKSVTELLDRREELTSLLSLSETIIESMENVCGKEEGSSQTGQTETKNPSGEETKNNSDPVVSGYVFTRNGVWLKDIIIKFVGGGDLVCIRWQPIPCLPGIGGPGAGGGGCAMVAHAQETCYRCIEWRAINGVIATTTSNSSGGYNVSLKSGHYNVYYSTPPNYPYPDMRKGTDIYLGTAYVSPITTYLNLVLPYPYQYDNDMDGIDDRVEIVVAKHHKPLWSFDSKQADGERFFPIHPKHYFTCDLGDEYCDINPNCSLRNDKHECVLYSRDYSQLQFYSNPDPEYGHTKYYIATKHPPGEHGKVIPFTTEDVFYHVKWRIGYTTQFHIQYYLFFNYNDTEVGFRDIGDHYADWEWLCIYPYQAPEGVWPSTPDNVQKYPYGGVIGWMHYHGHGANPQNCSEGCVRCWDKGKGGSAVAEVSVTRTEMEERGLAYYILSWRGPDIPKVSVGDDVHSFWGVYGSKEACKFSAGGYDFVEHINYCPAPEPNKVCPCEDCGDFDCQRKNNCLRYFTNLHSIEQIVGDDYDLTVRDYKGKWGGTERYIIVRSPFGGVWAHTSSPHGPTGSEGDRDYYGNFDGYKHEK